MSLPKHPLESEVVTMATAIAFLNKANSLPDAMVSTIIQALWFFHAALNTLDEETFTHIDTLGTAKFENSTRNLNMEKLSIELDAINKSLQGTVN